VCVTLLTTHIGSLRVKTEGKRRRFCMPTLACAVPLKWGYCRKVNGHGKICALPSFSNCFRCHCLASSRPMRVDIFGVFWCAIVMRRTRISLAVIYTSDTLIDSSAAEGKCWLVLCNCCIIATSAR